MAYGGKAAWRSGPGSSPGGLVNRNIYIVDTTYYRFAAARYVRNMPAARLIRVGPWLSQAERRTLNPHVKGSNPFGPAKPFHNLSEHFYTEYLPEGRLKFEIGNDRDPVKLLYPQIAT